MSSLASRALALTRQRMQFSAAAAAGDKLVAPAMTFISGEEMTHHATNLMLEKWITPFVTTDAWEVFDCSCKNRDNTNDKVLHDAVASGSKTCAIFKEPTVTPTGEQVQAYGLSKALPSPNGAMRRGWNGITISRDTIHIPGIKMGFEKPVLFERHAVGGEYGAGWQPTSRGRLDCHFYPDGNGAATLVDSRRMDDAENVAVVYHNPLDNVSDLAHHFFKRCLEAKVFPYVVTKKTVFKWQEGFWTIHKDIFDEHYKQDYIDAGLLPQGELQHLISDAATMQIIRWTGGGFGMCAHNYDGDMLTDEIAQVHRSPGFITSNLVGKNTETGAAIKEFEASHGTVSDLWHMHLRGEETSMNPLGLAEALIGAMQHAAVLEAETTGDESNKEKIHAFTNGIRDAMHAAFISGNGTRDLAGPAGLTTEQFVDKVAEHLSVNGAVNVGSIEKKYNQEQIEVREICLKGDLDYDKITGMFSEFDVDASGTIDVHEFTEMLIKLGVAPRTTNEAVTEA